MIKEFLAVVILLLCFTISTTNQQAQVLLNGEFQLPTYGWIKFMSVTPSETSDHWIGNYQVITQSYFQFSVNQYIDLQTQVPNGYMEQNFTVLERSFCTLTFLWGLMETTFPPINYEITIQIDHQSVSILTPTVDRVQSIYETTMTVPFGEHALTINQTKNTTDRAGFFVDNFSMICEPSPLPTASYQKQNQILYYVKMITTMSALLKNLHGLRTVFFLIDDLWLYVYDNREYKGVMKEIHEFTQEVQNIKWSIWNYEERISFNKFLQKIEGSDYSNYSNPKLMSVQGQDGSYYKLADAFCFITLPQTVFICFSMALIFKFIKDHSISVFIRRYCFLANFLQIVLEPNIAYFTFLFFNQAKIFFAFGYLDKFWLALSLALWGFTLYFCFCFYFIISRYYKIKAGYFLSHYYRTLPSISFLTFQTAVRSFFKGIVHAQYHYDYSSLIFFLCLIQVTTVLLSLAAQFKQRISLTRVQWLLCSFYHFFMFLLNLGLYVQRVSNLEQTGIFIQKSMIYLITLNSALSQSSWTSCLQIVQGKRVRKDQQVSRKSKVVGYKSSYNNNKL